MVQWLTVKTKQTPNTPKKIGKIRKNLTKHRIFQKFPAFQSDTTSHKHEPKNKKRKENKTKQLISTNCQTCILLRVL